MTFLENVDRAKLQKILLITISALMLVALALLLAIVIMSIEPAGIEGTDIEFEDYILEDKDVAAGSLILADASHPFEPGADLTATMTNCQEYRNANRGDVEKGPYYSMNNVQLSQISMGEAHNLLVAAENAIKGDDLLIKYAFYGDDGETEEYKTGMLMFLTNYEEEKLPEEYAAWLDENAATYGFVESFEDAYRYVGVAHAKYMTDEELTLAEYIEYLKENTSNENGLNVKVADEDYYIYYVAAEAEESIKVPADTDEYVISGTNEGGVVVTVKLDK